MTDVIQAADTTVGDKRAQRREIRDREMIAIMRAVAEASGLSLMAMRGRGRTPELKCARTDYVTTAYRAGYSTTELARSLGRDHTTVMHYLNRSRKAGALGCAIAGGAGADYIITIDMEGPDMDRLKQASERLGSKPEDIVSELIRVALSDNLISAILDR